MNVTIHDIARIAGVSIATVSHVINKTRYVSPELCDRVNEAIRQTGYITKVAQKETRKLVGKESVIALILPTLSSTTVYPRFAEKLCELIDKTGRIMATYITGYNFDNEADILRGLLVNKRIAGIFISPVSGDSSKYEKLLHSGIPVICVGRAFTDCSVPCVTYDNEKAIFDATEHLIKRGHTNIGVVVDLNGDLQMRERLDGYVAALNAHGIPFNDKLVMSLNEHSPEVDFDAAFYRFYESRKPTGIVACGNNITLALYKAITNTGLAYPKDISIVGFGDESWCNYINPPLTLLRQNLDDFAERAMTEMKKQIESGIVEQKRYFIPLRLSVNKSTRILSRGPFEEKAYSLEDIVITPEEKRELREGNYTVGISFHCFGTDSTKLYRRGIRDTFEDYGITVTSITDAKFDPNLQITQLDAINMQNPDAIIAFPVDDTVTADKFKEISQNNKLILIGSVPKGLTNSDYCTYVAINEIENGITAASLMGEYYSNKTSVNAGMLVHGANFYGTKMHDFAAEQTIREKYKQIRVVEKSPFYTIDKAYGTCKRLIADHPEIKTLYVSWDTPALEVIRALNDIDRRDITVFTCDLDRKIGKYLAAGQIIKGVSAQKAYELGVAAAKSVAKALLDNDNVKYVAVPPIAVKKDGLLAAWKEIVHESAPPEIELALEGIM